MTRLLSLVCLLALSGWHDSTVAYAPLDGQGGITRLAGEEEYVAAAVAGWEESPVYLSPDTKAVTAAQAAVLAERVDGWRDDVWIAILPAVVEKRAGSADADRAADFVRSLAAAQDRDGLYVVTLGRTGAFGASVGPGEDVAAIVAEQAARHDRDEVDEVLEGVLDDLGAPTPPSTAERIGTGMLLVSLVAAALVCMAGVIWSRRARRARQGE